MTPVFQAKAIFQALFASKCSWHFLASTAADLFFKLRVVGYHTVALAYYVWVIHCLSFLKSDLLSEAKVFILLLSESTGILEMNGEEVGSMASVMSENFEPQSKKQRLDNVDGEQQMDFETQIPSKSSEGNNMK